MTMTSLGPRLGPRTNIQSASVVVITEPQWKPSTEDQAIVRSHRMGQVRTVQVHRLLAKDSIDERIVDVQQRKRLSGIGWVGRR